MNGLNVTPKGADANDASVTMTATLIAVRLSSQAVMAIKLVPKHVLLQAF